MDAEAMVRNDILASIALGIDTARLYGTGGNNQPTGLCNTSGVSVYSYSGDSLSIGDYIAMESEIALHNADVASMRYLMNPQIRGAAKSTPRFPNSDSTIWETGNTINGYNTEVTNQIINNQVIFGDFSQLLVGLWDGLRITVDPYTLGKSGSIRVIAMQNIDFAVKRPELFVIANKAAKPE